MEESRKQVESIIEKGFSPKQTEIVQNGLGSMENFSQIAVLFGQFIHERIDLTSPPEEWEKQIIQSLFKKKDSTIHNVKESYMSREEIFGYLNELLAGECQSPFYTKDNFLDDVRNLVYLQENLTPKKSDLKTDCSRL